MGAAPSSPFGSREPRSRGVVSLRRGTLVATGAVLALLAAWGAISVWYLANHDKLAAHLLRKQSEMQHAYEEKIGVLRARLDQVVSQSLVERNAFETRVAEIVGRQAKLESRQAVVAALVDQVGTSPPASGLSKPEPPSTNDVPGAVTAYAPSAAKPTPLPEALGLRLRNPSPLPERAADNPKEERLDQSSLPVGERLGRLQRSLASIEAAQLRSVEGVMRQAQQRVALMRNAVGQAGLDPDRLDLGPVKDGTGGPLVPLPSGRSVGPFEAAVEAAQKTLSQLDLLRRAGAALPFARPTAGEAELTSGYGVRVDPFTRGPAMHTGLDFRADHGAAVRASGAGTVVSAEYVGGYGKMVEIEHANGVTSRYAHLSSLAVAPGQSVRAGTIIGRVGSTGRSTGPHLHYETRIDGAPVDPQRFLRAGLRMAEAVSKP